MDCRGNPQGEIVRSFVPSRSSFAAAAALWSLATYRQPGGSSCLIPAQFKSYIIERELDETIYCSKMKNKISIEDLLPHAIFFLVL